MRIQLTLLLLAAQATVSCGCSRLRAHTPDSLIAGVNKPNLTKRFQLLQAKTYSHRHRKTTADLTTPSPPIRKKHQNGCKGGVEFQNITQAVPVLKLGACIDDTQSGGDKQEEGRGVRSKKQNALTTRREMPTPIS